MWVYKYTVRPMDGSLYGLDPGDSPVNHFLTIEHRVSEKLCSSHEKQGPDVPAMATLRLVNRGDSVPFG